MRFVQFADVHLDSSIGGALNLPADKKAILQEDLKAALARACALAGETRADMALIPGDLFDYESVRPETAAFAADLFRAIAPIPVFITPGNHDNLWPGSPYTDPNGAKWPDNVHIFTDSCFKTIALAELDCTVTGIAHAHRGVTERALATPIPCEKRKHNILLFHGSRDGYAPPGKETVIPFSDAELISQGFSYAAIGHYHSQCQIIDAQGNIRGAYSGCLQGRGVDETGEKCVLVGEIDADGRVILEKREVAQRQIIGIEVDVTGAADNAALLGKLEAMLAASGARQCDIVSISLYGSAASTLKIDTSAVELSDRFFHVHVSAGRVEPDYDLEALAMESAASSLKSDFVRRMLELSELAKDESERKTLHDAVYYGLYALDGRKLEPRDAD
ncbi:MAG: metallophosphoesterase [Armatimonadetes bacterium]|nr:metallophosphoesterase [Armatimonadota bacterium]